MSVEEDLFDELLEIEEETEPARPRKPQTRVKHDKPKRESEEPVEIPVPEPEVAAVKSGSIGEPLPVETGERTNIAPRTVRAAATQISEPALEHLEPAPVEEPGEPVAELEEEEEDYYKLVVLIVGDKGTGKTVTALSFPGEVLVLSFDRKAAPIKRFFYKNDKRIHVYDVVKYVDWSPERITETSARAFQAIESILDRWRGRVDWVVIDGTDILEQLAEMYMRYRHGLGPIEGIRNRNIWKERKWILRSVHNKAMNTARKGVIYTVYPVWQERIVGGEVVERRQEPRWLDIILFETDVVLWTRYDESTGRFLVEVRTSKLDALFPTGKIFDVTGKPLGRQIDWRLLS